jgi:hypothetical protein
VRMSTSHTTIGPSLCPYLPKCVEDRYEPRSEGNSTI